jgi:hypothetical protein
MDINYINSLIEQNKCLSEQSSRNLEYHKNSVERSIKEIATYELYNEVLKMKKEELENNMKDKTILNESIPSYFI